mgnify:CR=1 FL=1
MQVTSIAQAPPEPPKETTSGFQYDPFSLSQDTVNKGNQLANYSNFDPTKNQDIVNSKNAWETHSSNKVADWTGGQYGQQLNDIVNKIGNREKFNYDLNGDMLYQQYKNQYMNLGNQAMMDTMGQASALTGGYGNSYASTAGNQAYQGYLTQLNDKIPQLYQMALDQYNREGENLYNQANLYGNMYNREYGEYRDKVSDWNTENNRLYNIYSDAYNRGQNQFNADRNFLATDYYNSRDYETNLYGDNWNRAFNTYENEQNQNNWQTQFDYNSQQDTIKNNQWQQTFDYNAQQDAIVNDQNQQKINENIRSNMESEKLAREKFEQDKSTTAEELALRRLQINSSNTSKSNGKNGADETPQTTEEAVAQEKEYLSGFSAKDWYDYFNAIMSDRIPGAEKGSGGVTAAQAEYERMRRAGLLPDDPMLRMDLDKLVHSPTR